MIMKKLMLTALSLLLFVSAAMAQNVPSYVPTNGIVGWWPFNGNANDESGNGNNGTNMNNVAFVNDRFGTSNAALDFPNFNSKIRIAHDLLGPTPCLADHSFSFWINLNSQASLNGNQQSIAFCNGRDPGQPGINAFGNLYYQFPNSVIEGAWYDRSVVRSSDSITTDEWHLITYVYNNSQNRLKVFIDGVDKTNYSYPTVVSGWSGNCNAPNPPFGNYYVGNSPYDNAKFDGNVDDLGVWNRALTQQEITDLYNGSTTSIEPMADKNQFYIHPNPARDHITINYGNFALMSGYQLRITNSLGQQMFQTNINQQSDYLDLSSWTGNGIYFVNIIDPSGNTVDIKKIVLQ